MNLSKQKKWCNNIFNWQNGYGVFSYAHSQIDHVIHYIRNQEKHHQKISFKNEYLEFLQKFNISFEEKYVFDFVDLQLSQPG